MILFITQEHSNYRLKSYWDFLKNCCLSIRDFSFTGRGFTVNRIQELSTAHPWIRGKVIPWEGPEMTLSRIRGIVGNIDHLFLFDTQSIVVDEFEGYKTTVLITDVLRKNDDRIVNHTKRGLNLDKVNRVLYNFRYEENLVFQAFPNAEHTYFPTWSSHEYDYEQGEPQKKVFDFLNTGEITHEYTFRPRYSAALRASVSQKNFIDNVHMQAFDPSVNYIDLLKSSKFCMCDGGSNGRVLAKYHESAMAKSIVVTPDTGPELRELGIIDGQTAIVHNRNISERDLAILLNFPEKYYDLEKMRQSAYQHTKNNHTSSARLAKFLGTSE